MFAGRVTPQISTSPARYVPVGSIASWISRATSSSPFSDSRSATSSSTQQVDQDEADEQRERAVGPERREARRPEERRAERNVDRREAAEQPDDADQRDDQRDQIERAPRRRQLQREGDEDLADAQRQRASTSGIAREPILVEPAGEEPVGVARVVREQPLQILAR